MADAQITSVSEETATRLVAREEERKKQRLVATFEFLAALILPVLFGMHLIKVEYDRINSYSDATLPKAASTFFADYWLLIFAWIALLLFLAIARTALGGIPLSLLLFEAVMKTPDGKASGKVSIRTNEARLDALNISSRDMRQLVEAIGLVTSPRNQDLMTNVHDPVGILRAGVDRSQQVVRNVRGWATANLLTGVIVAFTGVLVFIYSANELRDPLEADKGVWALFISMLAISIPKVAILVFIEIIAVFFLKQYRVSMDEYRNFETILRLREAQLFSALVRSPDQPKQELVELADSIVSTAKIQVLKKGETTELLESIRINSTNEAVDIVKHFSGIFEKLIAKMGSGGPDIQRLKT